MRSTSSDRPIVASRRTAGSPPARLDGYGIADTILLTDIDWPALGAFRVEDRGDADPRAAEDRCNEELREVFDGRVELGGATRRVRCAWSADGRWCQVDIELRPGVDDAEAEGTRDRADARPSRWLRCRIDARRSDIGYDFPGIAPAELAELALGPALVLALALRETFCLHASAVLLPEGVVAFMGDSGAGKSTLASELRACGMPQVADDLLLVRAGASPVALPRFPQPRWTTLDQPAEAPSSCTLAALYFLGGDHNEVTRERVGTAAATLAIARHTVAARLFHAPLLERHLSFAASLAAAAPGTRASLPLASWRRRASRRGHPRRPPRRAPHGRTMSAPGAAPPGAPPNERRAMRRSRSVASQTLDGEAVLLHLEGGTYFTLNETGTLVWQLLEQERSFDELLDAVLAAFEVDAETARRDLADLLEQLASHGLIESAPGEVP